MQLFGQYLAQLFRPFWNWWWAAITGVASLLSFWAVPATGLNLSKFQTGVSVLAISLLLFLLLSIVTQAWPMFLQRHGALQVTAIQPCKDYGGDYVFLLTGRLAARRGTLLEIRRLIGDVEAPFALLEMLDANARGINQAKPIWFAPGHLSEFAAGKVSLATLVVDPLVKASIVSSYIIATKQGD